MKKVRSFTGTVKSLTNFGAFVDLGGVDGMIHISELSWNRIKHPSEVVSVGDTVQVYVKSLDRENGKISLATRRRKTIRGRSSRTSIRLARFATLPVDA